MPPAECWGACDWRAIFNDTGNVAPVVGTYTNVRRSPASATQPGLDFGGDTRGCNSIYGEFEVLEAEYSAVPGNEIVRFAANFTQRCDDDTNPPLNGKIRFNSTIPLNENEILVDGFETGDTSGWNP